MQEDLLEAFRTPLFFVYISMLLSFCVASGSQLGDRVELEFHAYRLQQYEVAGSIIGSKSFRVLYEAVGIDAAAARKCTMASWRDLINRDLESLFKTAVGSLIVVLPADYSALSPAERKSLIDLETLLSITQTELSVYAIRWSESAAALLADVSSTSTVSTGMQQLLHAVTSNTFQLTSATTSVPASITYKPKNIITRLSGSSHNSPTIVFVAHYDTHSAFPDLGDGTDSNGSGVVALLELLSILKRFYDRPATRPNYHMLFVWTAAGKHNYQGARSFIEELQDKYPDDKLELALCLDSIGQGDSLNVHLSKVPNEGTVVDRFIRYLRAASINQTIDVIAKKINLQQPFAWEHERFNVKRLPSITLSHLSVPSEITRRSIMDSTVDTTVLSRNVRTIAEATLSLILSLPERASHKDERVSSESSLLSPHAINKERLSQLLSRIASHPRPLSSQSSTEECASNIASLATTYGHTSQHIVQLETTVVPSSIERILAEKTKPAIFDLFLAGGIAVYLALFMRITLSSQSILEGVLTTLRKSN